MGMGRGDRSKKGWKNKLGEPGASQGKWQKSLGWGLLTTPSTHPTNQARRQARQELRRCVLCPLHCPQSSGSHQCHPPILSVAAAPQAQSLGHHVLRKGGWWPARLSQPQKPPEQAHQIACLNPGVHRGEDRMMAWHGTASPTSGEPRVLVQGPPHRCLSTPEDTWPHFPSSPPRPVRGDKGQFQGSVAPIDRLITSLQAMPGNTLLLLGQSRVASEGPWPGRVLVGGVGQGQRMHPEA